MIEDEHCIKDYDLSYLTELANDPKWFHYTGLFYPQRPGVALFNVLLEYIFYKPNTEDNDKILMAIINWEDSIWSICSIPKEDFKNAEIVSKKTGLKIVHGVPVSISYEGIIPFLMNSNSVFTLEFRKKHPLYDLNFDEQILITLEYELIQKIKNHLVDPQEVDLMKFLKRKFH